MCLSIKVKRPDAVLAEGEHNGYQWAVTSNGRGFRCGYVRVPKGHPWHGKDYDEVHCNVHGDLTFAEPDLECDKPGPDDAWWIGFDCAHLGDAQDPELKSEHVMRNMGGVVRTQDYVEAQCRSLCEQAVRAAKS